jgi:CheY-specific phosphatase CheX
MKAEHANLFLKATLNVFDTMLSCQPRRLQTKSSDVSPFHSAITAVIEFEGSARGSIALTMPDKTGITAANRMLGGGVRTSHSNETKDVILELLNMIAVNAKSEFGSGQSLTLGQPILVGEGDSAAQHLSDIPSIEIPYTCEIGRFDLRLAIKPE